MATPHGDFRDMPRTAWTALHGSFQQEEDALRSSGSPAPHAEIVPLLRCDKLAIGPVTDGRPVYNRMCKGAILHCTAALPIYESVADWTVIGSVDPGSLVVATSDLAMRSIETKDMVVQIEPKGTIVLDETVRLDMNGFSILERIGAAERRAAVHHAQQSAHGDRSIGAFVGMAAGDAVGAALEFISVLEIGRHSFNPETLELTGALDRFQLKPGQWTDDTSMGLCLADSLLVCREYNGSDIRLRFWNWWYKGYNNAFRRDSTLTLSKHTVGQKCSIGCGANVKQSLSAILDSDPPPRFKASNEDAGNGSLMRLAAIPIFFHRDEELTMRVSSESSLTTHPGGTAADACAFLGFVLVRAITRSALPGETAAAFLDQCAEAYLARSGVEEKVLLTRLLRGMEPEGSKEWCWNWRDPAGPYLRETVEARGAEYNGYPVKAEYLGSFCLDGLAMALHSVYHTSSFMEAVSKCVNFLGDADTTGAICGQIAGAFYGYQAIDDRLVQRLNQWDDGEIALRAALLHSLGAERSSVDCEQTWRVLGQIDSAD